MGVKILPNKVQKHIFASGKFVSVAFVCYFFFLLSMQTVNFFMSVCVFYVYCCLSHLQSLLQHSYAREKKKFSMINYNIFCTIVDLF